SSAPFTFNDNGSYTVYGRIFDKDGGASTSTTTVVVNNVPPAVTAPASQSSNEGASTSFSLGSFADPGVNDGPWAVDVNWGDGSAHGTFTTSTQGSLGSLSHSYANNGSYTVTVSVQDKDSATGTASFAVSVANV